VTDQGWQNLLERCVQRYAAGSTATVGYLWSRLQTWTDKAFWYGQWREGNVDRATEEVCRHLRHLAETRARDDPAD